MSATYWLSFANEQYLGAVMVDTDDFMDAYFQATFAKVNPGGEVKGKLIPHDSIPGEFRDAFMGLPRLTLLTIDDLRVLGTLRNERGEVK